MLHCETCSQRERKILHFYVPFSNTISRLKNQENPPECLHRGRMGAVKFYTTFYLFYFREGTIKQKWSAGDEFDIRIRCHEEEFEVRYSLKSPYKDLGVYRA